MTKWYPGSPSGAVGDNVVKVIQEYKAGICLNNRLYWISTQHAALASIVKGLYWPQRHWMWDHECPVWEVYVAIYFEIEVFWKTETDNTAEVMCFPAQESSLFFFFYLPSLWIWIFCSRQRLHVLTTIHQAKRVCPGFEWCSSVSSILHGDSYPLTGHITTLY